MATVQIDGKRVYIYRLCEGEYSDYREDWWYHESPMTGAELHAHLVASLPLAEEAERKWRADQEAFAQERFGCAAKDVDFDFHYPIDCHVIRGLKTPRGTLADANEWYGDGNGYLWDFKARDTLLRVAGLSRLEPDATYDNPCVEHQGEEVDAVRERLGAPK